MMTRGTFRKRFTWMSLVFILPGGIAVYGIQPDETQCRAIVKGYLSSFENSLIDVMRPDRDSQSRIEYSTTSGVFRSRDISSGEREGKPYHTESHKFSNLEWNVGFMERTVDGKKYDGILVGRKLDESPLARFSPTAETLFIVDKQSGEPASQFIGGKCEFSAKDWPKQDATLTFTPVPGSRHVFQLGYAESEHDGQKQLVVKQINSYFNLDPQLADKRTPYEQRNNYEERLVNVVSFQKSDPYRTPEVLDVKTNTRLVNGTEYPGHQIYKVTIRPLENELGETIELIGRSFPSPSPVRMTLSPDIPHVLRDGKIFKVVEERPLPGSIVVDSRNYAPVSYGRVYWSFAIGLGVIASILLVRRHWR